MSISPEPRPRPDEVDAVMDLLQMVYRLDCSPADRQDIARAMEPAYAGGDGTARGLVGFLLHLHGYRDALRRQTRESLDREFQVAEENDRGRLIARIRAALEPQPPIDPSSEGYLEAQREAYRSALEEATRREEERVRVEIVHRPSPDYRVIFGNIK